MPRDASNRGRFWNYEASSKKDPHFNADMALCNLIEAELWRHYPDHMWHVTVDHGQGVAMIQIPMLMGNHKYIIKLQTLKNDPALKSVIQAGGEILERFNIPRASLAHGLDEFHTAKMRRDVRTRKWTPRAA